MTGSVAWLDLVVLCGWSLLAGLLVSIGTRGAVVGTQAIIALVVFGRFSQPVVPALGLAGLVFAGGSAQVLFLRVVRWPTTLRTQRSATGSAYRKLSAVAAAGPEESTIPAALALDEAEATLSSPAMAGDPALMTLRSLVDEGRRMRIALSAIHALVGQPAGAASDSSPDGRPTAAGALTLAASGLGLAALAIEGDRGSAALLSHRVAQSLPR